MTTYVGGFRARLVLDNLYNMLYSSLDELGWFDSAREHKPINFTPDPVDEEATEVPINTLALSDEDLDSEDEEMGSNYASHSWTFYVDFYAENRSLGVHLINDVKAILEGRMPSISRTYPVLEIVDLSQTPAVSIGTCEIEDVVVDKGRGFPNGWQKYWYTCRFTVVDFYGNENDA
jgi:hypothetical protein